MPGPDRNEYIRRFMENYGEEVIPPLGERVSEYMPGLEDAIQTIRRWIEQRTGVAAAAPKTSEDQLMDLINIGMPGAPVPEGFTRETWAEAQAGARRALAAMTGQPTGPLQPVPSAEEEWGRGRRKVSQDIYTDTEERMRRADEIMAQLEPKKAYLPLVGGAPPERETYLPLVGTPPGRETYLPLVGTPATQTGRTPPMMEPPPPIPRRVSQRTPQMLEPGQEMTKPPTVLTWEMIGEWLAPLVQAIQENAGNAMPEGARSVPAGVGMGANAAPMPSAMSWLGSLLQGSNPPLPMIEKGEENPADYGFPPPMSERWKPPEWAVEASEGPPVPHPTTQPTEPSEGGGLLGWLRGIVDTMRTPPEERLLPGSPVDQYRALFGAPSTGARSPTTGARVPSTADEIGIAGPSLRNWLREGNAPATSPDPFVPRLFGDTEGGGSTGGGSTGGSTSGGSGGGSVGGGVDPAMEAWWNEFMYRHGGENPVEYYGGTWGRSSDEALAEALWDKAWGEDFARKHGQSPSEDTWKESYYAREAMKRAALANSGAYDPWYAQAPW